MAFYDWFVIGVALVVATGLLIGIKELTYAIRARVRRRRVRSEMAALSVWPARTHAGAQGRPVVSAMYALPATDTGRAVRDPVIGVDQMLTERRARFLLHLDDRGLCLDDLRIEPKLGPRDVA